MIIIMNRSRGYGGFGVKIFIVVICIFEIVILFIDKFFIFLNLFICSLY